MAFTLLHTADWQIGKAFGTFEPEVQGVLRDARLAAIDRLAAIARERGARHVLVAGDVYEAETLPLKALRQPLEKMRTSGDLTWHLLPGNHDPDRPDGVWQRIKADGVPSNVRLLLAPETVEIEPGLHLLPAPLKARATTGDPTAWMDHASTPPGHVRVGIAHGSVRGFGHEGEPSTPIAASRAAAARLDYLALGDWHGCREAGPKAWYSGTPEPDRHLDNEPGHALVVRLPGAGAPPAVERVATGRFHWLRRDLALCSADPWAELEELIAGLPDLGDRLLLDLRLTGSVTPAGYAALTGRLDRLEPRLRVLERSLEAVRIDAAAVDGTLAEASGELAAVARWLAARAKEPGPEAELAARALARLAALASAEGP